MSDDDHGVRPSEDEGGASQKPAGKRFPTVGIGTSAGGVHALQTFFESLSNDVDAAFVVVLHLDPSHQSELPNILANRRSLSTGRKAASRPLNFAISQGEPAMAGASSGTLCPISSELGQLSRSNRTASAARSRFRFPDLRLRRSTMASSPLRDRRILVVEDEYLIAMSLQDALENAGSVVVGPVPSVDKAIQKIESEPDIDAAVVDVNLGGLLAYPVADMLIARKIPFVFTSGYDDNVLRERYSQVKNCPTPYLFQAMEEALVEAMSLS